MKKRKAAQISIIEFVAQDLSGMVKCELIDCKGKKWKFSGKPKMFTGKEISENTKFPQTGLLPCQIEAKRMDKNGKLVLLVNTSRWKVDTIDYGGYFELYENQVVDL